MAPTQAQVDDLVAKWRSWAKYPTHEDPHRRWWRTMEEFAGECGIHRLTLLNEITEILREGAGKRTPNKLPKAIATVLEQRGIEVVG